MPKAKQQDIKLNPLRPLIDERYLEVMIEGTSPLIVHAWSQKALKEILAKQRKHAKGGREVREPEREYLDARYKDIEGDDAILAAAVKNAMVTSVSSVEGMTKVSARQSFFVTGWPDKERPKIIFDKKVDGKLREDMVRLGGPSNPADLRFRPCYYDWKCQLYIQFNALVISKEQVVNLLALAGFSVGLHEWRVERDGDFGKFEVIQVDEVKKPKWDKSTKFLRRNQVSVWSMIKALEEDRAIPGDEAVKAKKNAKEGESK